MTIERLSILSVVLLFGAAGLGEGVTQGVLGAVCAAAAYRLWREWPVEPTRATTRLLLLFIAWCAGSMLFSPYGFPRGSEAARLYNFLPFALVPFVLDGAPLEARQRAAKALVAVLAVVSVYAFLQYRFGVWFFAELSGAAENRWTELVPGTDDRYYAGGFFFHRLKLSHALAIGIPAALFVLRGRWRWTIALMLPALWMTFARAALGAVIVAVFVTAVLDRKLSAKLFAIVSGVTALCAAVLVVALPSAAARISSIATTASYGERFFLWSLAKEIILDHPWLGIGFGHYSRVCGPYYDRVDPTFEMRSQAHNQLLTLWAETGPVGAALWIALIVASFVAVRRQPDPGLRSFGTAVILVHTVIGLVHDPFIAHGVTCILFSAATALAFPSRQRVGE